MKGRVAQLDGLRGVFAVLILRTIIMLFLIPFFTIIFFVKNAGLFVDFFFVLSGFVIAKNYINRINSSVDFFNFLKAIF